jgi:hypothetical protein
MPVTKKDGKWEAEDKFDFMGTRRLVIQTYKYDARLLSCASVNNYLPNGICSHAFGLSAGGDWSKYGFIVSGDRATEKNVAAQHAKALELKDQFLAEARAHYEKYPPRED